MIKAQIKALKYLISTNRILYISNESLVGSLLPFLNESTINLLVFLNVGSIR